MRSSILLTIISTCAGFFPPALATTIHQSSKKVCTEYTVPLTVTSTNLVFGLPKFKDNYDATDFFVTLTQRTAADNFHPFKGIKNETATYKLSGTFCTPKHGGDRKDTVLIATHGLNFGRGYWDPEIEPERYSFVDAAIKEGYSIFFYDRLGVGKSEKVSGYLNQISIQVALATELTKSIRNGKYTSTVGKPKKVVLVGHSYGSAVSAAVLAANPNLAEGLVLTGFSYAGNSVSAFVQASQYKIAAIQSPARWRSLDTGYVTPVDLFSTITSFFKQPFYTTAVAKYADANKEPIAVSELLSATTANLVPDSFRGAAIIISGRWDFIFCGSDCNEVIETPARQIFAKAKAFKAVSYEKGAHGLNFALEAPGAFKQILQFINTNV